MSELDDFLDEDSNIESQNVEDLMFAHLDKFGVEDKDREIEAVNPPSIKSQKAKNKVKRRVLSQETEADLEIDLHGQTSDESEFLFEQVLKEVQIRKLSTVRFIHGGHVGHYGPVKTKLDFLIKRVYRSKIKRSYLDSHNDGATLVEFVKFD